MILDVGLVLLYHYRLTQHWKTKVEADRIARPKGPAWKWSAEDAPEDEIDERPKLSQAEVDAYLANSQAAFFAEVSKGLAKQDPWP